MSDSDIIFLSVTKPPVGMSVWMRIWEEKSVQVTSWTIEGKTQIQYSLGTLYQAMGQ